MHRKTINKLISLPNNRFASCSSDRTITIWNDIFPIKNLIGHSDQVLSIIYIKEKELLISCSSDRTLRIWDMRTFQCNTVFKNVNCCHSSGLCQIDRDRVYCFLPLLEDVVVMGNGKGGFAFMMLTIINFFILIYKQSNNVYGRFIIRYS